MFSANTHSVVSVGQLRSRFSIASIPTTTDFLVFIQCQPYLYLGNFSRKPHYYTVKRTKLQTNGGVPRFFADKSRSSSSSINNNKSTQAQGRSYDLVLDFKNLLIKSGASLQSIVEKAARLNGILDKELVNNALIRVTSMLPSMRNVHVTLEEPAIQTAASGKQHANYKFKVSLDSTKNAELMCV